MQTLVRAIAGVTDEFFLHVSGLGLDMKLVQIYPLLQYGHNSGPAFCATVQRTRGNRRDGCTESCAR